MRQLVYTMFISNNRASSHLLWKENLVKHQKVSKYYEYGRSLSDNFSNKTVRDGMFGLGLILSHLFNPLNLNILDMYLETWLWSPVIFAKKLFTRKWIYEITGKYTLLTFLFIFIIFLSYFYHIYHFFNHFIIFIIFVYFYLYTIIIILLFLLVYISLLSLLSLLKLILASLLPLLSVFVIYWFGYFINSPVYFFSHYFIVIIILMIAAIIIFILICYHFYHYY